MMSTVWLVDSYCITYNEVLLIMLQNLGCNNGLLTYNNPKYPFAFVNRIINKTMYHK